VKEFKFEWDYNKNRTNRNKHGIWFEEAKQIFNDPQALLLFDSENSIKEDRYILLGKTAFGKFLIVVHCEREKEPIIRIISARRATRKEIEGYAKRI